MAKLLSWPSKYFFYAIGNTSAVTLTSDLPPEEPAKVLLLGCGDPRNVLHTVFCEPRDSGRALDFTCSDFDAAVLARNVLLLTMITDEIPHSTIWNTFFHFRLDTDSHTALISQCTKLIECSSSLQTWAASKYSPFIKFSTEYTLKELRRHWTLYADMPNLPPARLSAINNAFERLSKENLQHPKRTSTLIRSLGPLGLRGEKAVFDSYRTFWKTGTIFLDGKRLAAATMLNPTFVYSLGGEGCNVHYGTDPLVPFHFAALFGNAKSSVTMPQILKAANEEFQGWCEAYFKSLSSNAPPVVRFFVGEATAVCGALKAFDSSGVTSSGIPVQQWKTQLIQLNKDEYRSSVNNMGTASAPTNFNVIHTSNLEDHMGLLNVLISSIPVLSPSSNSVIYTESLLFLGQNATKEFTEQLHVDLTVFGLLVGLAPVDYLCGFTSRSNTHELLRHNAMRKELKKEQNISQFHQMTTWKRPTSGDTIASQHPQSVSPPVFDGHQLGTLLYDVYQSLFENESSMNFWAAHQKDTLKAISVSNLAHYSRESFALFLKLIRDHLQPTEETWTTVMDRFISLQLADWSIQSMDTLHYQDLCGQFLRYGLYKAPFMNDKAAKIGPFASWDTIPDLVRIVLVIPREKLAVLEHSNPEEIGTPPLQCEIFGQSTHNLFTGVHVAFGRASFVGTKARPQVIFEEDTRGWQGDAPLVASFVISALMLTGLEPPTKMNVGFGVRNTPAACATLIKKLGINLRVFSARLMDDNHVYVLPEQPVPSRYAAGPALPRKPSVSDSQSTTSSGPLMQIGDCGPAYTGLDEQCELATTLTVRLSITNEESARVFSEAGGKAVPEVAQLSPCVVRLSLKDCVQNVVFPFPVIGSSERLRLARKSRYIELIVPPSRSFLPDGMQLNPFPVIKSQGALQPWTIHRVNLAALPALDMKAKKISEWFNVHVATMMSNREISLRNKNKVDTLTFVKDTLQAIFVAAAGTGAGVPGSVGGVRRLLALRDKKTNNCDTVLFISDFRFDLAFHTMVCDGYVLPLTNTLLGAIEQKFAKLVNQTEMVSIMLLEGEVRAWKQLLPAFAERCRTWNHTPNCEYLAQGKIPLTEEMEADPLCSCGRGKDVEGMNKNPLWKSLAGHVTRIALSPLFGVSYLETVGRPPEAHKCSVCRKKGNPRLKECQGCKKVRYCSAECQKKDWKAHKPKCKS